ncbi:type IV toxin-antitoxin system AbiEi family antitoxin domain-containing protein [Acidicapsa acidisoli]|uniref:type IV toxin-antitoxin system AbiEi family antitoxin domain-containing protein n=1 Tax=Acidicapsa acidisoli TaxID=1615681 RepID=UPI0021E06AE2|nr:type IV toxin-antitoxin system AbiEi family antitoxin domain-containing protein [Acidicapsa acidisoli]
MDELFALAEVQDGLFTSKEARSLGIQDSVLVRLRQRGRLERMSRGVYRIAHYPAERFAQYREAILWGQASNGPERIALSHETALLLYGISDVNPSRVNLTVPVSARMRRVHPKWIAIHRANLATEDIQQYEGMPVTTVERSILDVLTTTRRTDVAHQAITDALRKGLLNTTQARVLRQRINRSSHSASLSTNANKVKVNEPSTT